MNPIKIVHIHSDRKFIDIEQDRFEYPQFSNTVMILEEKSGPDYNGKYKEGSLYFRKDQLQEILEVCKSADVVILYALYDFKARIAIELPKSVKILWRFFGHELYRHMHEVILSEKTKSFLHEEPFFYKTLKGFYHRVRYGLRGKALIQKAMKKIDHILLISEEEYNFLKTHWKNLPDFIGIPSEEKTLLKYNVANDQPSPSHNGKPTVIIGNNKNIYNNHLDILEMIEADKNKASCQFILLCNYGGNNVYYDELKRITRDKEYYRLIEDFLSFNEFLELYQNVDAILINGYRQMALGNIFLGLRNGKKIYLNTKNSIYETLTKAGFVIHTMEDFKEDLATNNFRLDADKAQYNIKQWYNLEEKYSSEEFIDKMVNIVKKE